MQDFKVESSGAQPSAN